MARLSRVAGRLCAPPTAGYGARQMRRYVWAGHRRANAILRRCYASPGGTLGMHGSSKRPGILMRATPRGAESVRVWAPWGTRLLDECVRLPSVKTGIAFDIRLLDGQRGEP